MAGITFDAVSVEVAGARVLADVGFEIADGRLVGVVGPSGSGKTTLLRVVAGLQPVRSGRILFDGADVTARSPGARDVGMVFQDPALFPHRDVGRNVAFPLEIRRHHAEEIRTRVGAEVRALQVEHLLRRRPAELSRGEEHLVQIARALVRVPRVLLLDEPFASLDAHLRVRMRREIGLLQEGYGVTTLMTTNDWADAMALPDLLAVLEGGRLVQYAAPGDVRRAPATVGAAAATGPISVVPVAVRRDASGPFVEAAPGDGTILRHRVATPALADRAGETVLLLTRPDEVVRDPQGEVVAVLDRRIPGSPPTLTCHVGRHILHATGAADDVEIGGTVALRLERALLFDASTGYSID